ncbi:MAG: glucose-6-phosphate dehydrogenase [Dissulfurispiraceae bacterium]
MTSEIDKEVLYSKFLQTCDIPAEKTVIEPFTMVIFGGAGDLSKRKLLPAIFSLFCDKVVPDQKFSILGFGRNKMSDEDYRAMMKDAVKQFGEGEFDEEKWDQFSRHLYFLSGDFGQDESYEDLSVKISRITIPDAKGSKEVVYYMAVPPQVVPMAVHQLKKHNLCQGIFNTKIIIEKPFGNDRKSAVEFNKVLTDTFDERQIYRIDHYLAKDPVQNIIFLRFINTLFAEIWNRHYVDNVQITVAEDVGIEHRGAFYEQAGVVRDIVQNHMMQLFGLIAMEPPVGFKDDFIREEKLKIFRSVHSIDANYLVRGQYGRGELNGSEVPGYRAEDRVASDSNVPTFFAGKFYIDNLRWAGVPFYFRTGKRMPRRVTEICLQLKHFPVKLFGRTCDILEPNILVLTIQPHEKISLRFSVKYPYSENQVYPVDMVFNYNETFKLPVHPAYERLLVDMLKGDMTLFVRQDTVEEMWEIVDPIISLWESTPPLDFPNYAAGTWGPEAANRLLEQDGRRWITR